MPPSAHLATTEREDSEIESSARLGCVAKDKSARAARPPAVGAPTQQVGWNNTVSLQFATNEAANEVKTKSGKNETKLLRVCRPGQCKLGGQLIFQRSQDGAASCQLGTTARLPASAGSVAGAVGSVMASRKVSVPANQSTGTPLSINGLN